MSVRDPAQLLRRLNAHCAQALEAAATLAQTRAHAEITPEHWLIKLLEQGDGDIPAIARRYKLDMDAVWQGLLGALDQYPHALRGKPGLSRPLQEWLQAAWLIASLEQDCEQIRSAHLLHALQDNPHWLRARDAWPLLSVSAAQIARLVPELNRISLETPQSQGAAPNVVARAQDAAGLNTLPGKVQPEALQRYTIDLTEKARAGQIDPVFGRDVEIRQMIDILARRRKNNPILVGDPGVGKTALVEGLALKIAEGDVPISLQSVVVLVLDLGLLQAGAGVKGEFEQRLKNVIDAVQASPAPILLFIDEAHTLIGAGNSAGGADAANLLKPALARGELRTIAATTWSEYKQYFERDVALERRFQMVKVDEPDDAAACLMLRGLQSRYAAHHGVHIRDEAIVAAVQLSRRYLTGRQLPDKAVDLIDTAAARVRMSLDATPAQIEHCVAQLRAAQTEHAALCNDLRAGGNNNAARLAQLDGDIAAASANLARLQGQHQQELTAAKTLQEMLIKVSHPHADSPDIAAMTELREQLAEAQRGEPLVLVDVDAAVIAAVIADWTGVPLSSLLKNEQASLLELEAQLQQRVVGQDDALISIASSLRAARTGLRTSDGPLGVFLLAGTSGVGKTETALALADALFGGERAVVTINLSEYQEAHTVSQLKGSPPGYVGYGQGGMLTEAVRHRPYSIVLLDEVEKAHRDVLNLFYQVFDRGFMRDGEGREIDFRNTVILMTSNLGSAELMALHEQDPLCDIALLHEAIRPQLIEHFQPALLARFQTVIYRPLALAPIRDIVQMKLAKVSARMAQHYATTLTFAPSLPDFIAASCLLPDTGARNIDHLLNQQILPTVSQALLQWQVETGAAPVNVDLAWEEVAGLTLAMR
ncbi:type VI secretion system ATPase TssH [Amantichitinum ursilacus]|uniref:Chaperone protein ClpB n=1 Tax=Amantichitinum ursilacus TaxID=857265 RepID=A0A0N0GNB2_9NEIS|nr:type VI secretion system ATPase TssH [Amantichitinum ursilacus]KPC52622.1 Chaperone protein ClpB [Amantichitinum ursilacus]